MNMTLPIFRSLWILSIHRNRQFVISSKFLYIFLIYRYNSSTSFNNQERLKMITFISDALFILYIFAFFVAAISFYKYIRTKKGRRKGV